MALTQLTLNFEAGLAECFGSCREVVQSRIYQQNRLLKHIAADMDLSPSALSRKLAQSPNDTMKFTLDDLEGYLSSTPDRDPIYYLVEKYLTDESQIKKLEAELERLKGQMR
jgi:hypothetical protein